MNNKAIRTLTEAHAVAVSQTASQMLSEVRNEQVIPFDTGNLQNESSFVDDSQAWEGLVKIVHDTPYARRLYYNPQYTFNTSKNPNARGEWWENWLTGDKKDRPKIIFKQLYVKAARRYVK